VRVTLQTLWPLQCQKRMAIHDYEERRWRHLDSCQFKTFWCLRVPIVRCLEHGSQTVAVPWAGKYDRFSRLFERLAIDVSWSVRSVELCEILGISWDEADWDQATGRQTGTGSENAEGDGPFVCG